MSENSNIKVASTATTAEPKLQGTTFDGVEFVVPRTSGPWNWRVWTWNLEASVSGISFWLYFIYPFLGLPSWLTVVFFVFWRCAYNFGIGYLLYAQSNQHLLTKWYTEWLNPDPVKRPAVYAWTKKVLSASRGDDYDFDKAPAALNTWFLFRLLADFVLAHDLGSYMLVLVMYWEWPERFTLGTYLLYLVGFSLAAFAAWAKRDAYRVIKDYAWYWGDFFFTVKQSLTFDRVFSLTPHPMYTIGYAFMYGFALLARSYTLLYVGLFGHVCQFIFLQLVENPHIDKIYGAIQATHSADDVARQRGYLRRDLIAFRNFNPFRSSDLFFIVIVAQQVACYFWNLSITQYAVMIVLWRLIHTVGLGVVLHYQSNYDMMVKRFEAQGWTRNDAFDSWKKIYNVSATMQWIVLIVAALSEYPSQCWTDYSFHLCVTKHIVGIALVALNIWSVMSQFETLGDFGWFYGDFFITDSDVEMKLSYQGVYRFLNNPDAITGFAGMYGLALIAESFTLFLLVAFGQFSAYAFVVLVERPHMKRKYGDAVRGRSGAASALREIVDETIENVSKNPVINKAKKFLSSSNLMTMEDETATTTTTKKSGKSSKKDN